MWVNVGFSGGVLAVCFWVIRCSDALLECPSREALRALFAFPVPHGMIYIYNVRAREVGGSFPEGGWADLYRVVVCSTIGQSVKQ